jgi:hypothetical protein
MKPFVVLFDAKWPSKWEGHAGFMVSRVVLADDPSEAVPVAEARLRSEIAQKIPHAPHPEIHVEEIWEGEMEQVTEPLTGWAYYLDDD